MKTTPPLTKTSLLKTIRKLKRKALRLWKERVKERAGGVCEVCGESKMVQAHHIQTERMHPELRYDPRNGVACDPRCHKFGRNSFHQSFVFTYKFLKEKRPDDLEYLLEPKVIPKVLEKTPAKMDIEELKALKTYLEEIIFSLDSEKAIQML